MTFPLQSPQDPPRRRRCRLLIGLNLDAFPVGLSAIGKSRAANCGIVVGMVTASSIQPPVAAAAPRPIGWKRCALFSLLLLELLLRLCCYFCYCFAAIFGTLSAVAADFTTALMLLLLLPRRQKYRQEKEISNMLFIPQYNIFIYVQYTIVRNQHASTQL